MHSLCVVGVYLPPWPFEAEHKEQKVALIETEDTAQSLANNLKMNLR